MPHTARTESRLSSSSTLSPSTQDSLYSWSRSVHMSRHHDQLTRRPSSSGSMAARGSRITSGGTGTATSLWSEDGAETVAPSKGSYGHAGSYPSKNMDAGAEVVEGDLIQLSDTERRPARRTPAVVQSDESLLDSQAEFSGLRADEERDSDIETDPRDEAVQAPAPIPTPGDKLRQLLAQMQEQSDLHRTTARAASPVKRPIPLVGAGPSSSVAADSDTRVKEGWRRTSGTTTSSAGYQRHSGGTGQGQHQGEAGPSSPPLNVRKANWREGRRIGVVPPASPPRSSTRRRDGGLAGSGAEAAEEEEGDNDSPPTPPMRILNPFAMSARRREQSAALAAEQEERRSRSPQHLRSALETYISHHPAIPPPIEPSSSSASVGVQSSTAVSRKGKERVQQTPSHRGLQTELAALSSRAQHPRTSRSYAQTQAQTRRRHPLTPRRSSIDMAPDDSALFAQEAEGLDVPLGVVDMSDDMSGIGAPWDVEDDIGGPEGEEGRAGEGASGGRSISHHTLSLSSPGDGTGANRSRESSGLDDSGRLSRLLRRSQQSSASERGMETSRIEAQRESSGFAEDSVGRQVIDIPSSSRPGHTAHPHTQSHPSHRPQEASRLHTPAKARHSAPANPNYSNMATPHPPGWLAQSPMHPVAITRSTASPARAVRFSPLRKTDADWSATESSMRTGTTLDAAGASQAHITRIPAEGAEDGSAIAEEEGAVEDRSNLSVHRLKLRGSGQGKSSSASSPQKRSPLRSSRTRHSPEDRSGTAKLRTSPRVPAGAEADTSLPIDPDSSFALRLLAPLKLSRLFPTRSQTYSTAAPLIAAAEQETLQAQKKVIESQKLWVEAVEVLQRLEGKARGMMLDVDGTVVREAVVEGVKRGVGWGWFVGWLVAEVLLMWAVFRVTIEYARPSLLNSLYTPDLSSRSASSSSPFGLAIPMPHGLSAFVVRQSRSSVNFFDLLERADFWLTGLSLQGGGGGGLGKGRVGGWEGGSGRGGVPS